MNIAINGQKIKISEEKTILEVARENGIGIPTLCYMKERNNIAECRMCVVEIMSRPGLYPACSTYPSDGMEILTNSTKVISARRKALELMFADHVTDCTNCSKMGLCKLREYASIYGVDDRYYGVGKREKLKDNSTSFLVRDNTKCILCRRCVAICEKEIRVTAIGVNQRSTATNVGFGIELAKTECISCGRCIKVCPTGALNVADDTKRVWKAIYDKKIKTVALLSDETISNFGEFVEDTNHDVANKIVTLLKNIGIDKVYRLSDFDSYYKQQKKIAFEEKRKDEMILDGMCEGFKYYLETYHKELKRFLLEIPDKKTMLAELLKRDCDIFVINIDNCVAKKRRTNESIDYPIDVSITTRELYEIYVRSCVSTYTAASVWECLSEKEPDRLPDELTKCAHIEVEEERDVTIIDGLDRFEQIVINHGLLKYMRVRVCPEGCKSGGGGYFMKE
ncbi:[Fe-Fe] hydrogenase large subunit C-terminal domain-containing protein [Eubacterium oxidoreducens]|uniref:Ferredoxin n=1 Tax=Eubacterium oxidoreducens TaxID=1732 RepID=A0A1G6CJ36_EUBOX|nr:[Fe-Fe] hydrogenase large subunit C-terminal domain-containing protein [Eubacterium oxidoreducens]SDB32933.1 4Fe-4S dicluster domain-containing protein [Eubacterium oxidoreducens]